MAQNLTPIFTGRDAARAPAAPGAYALLILLKRRFTGRIGALGEVALPRGAYLYLGSAHGAGGLHARLARHALRGKKPHWHIDRLTADRPPVSMLAAPGASECDLADRARAFPGATVPVAGFGSSDCGRCPAHLVAVPGDGRAALDFLAAYSAASGSRTYSAQISMVR